MSGHGRRWLAAACMGALLAAPATALARAATIPPSGFASDGDTISGWQWLRRSGQTATWTFDLAPLQAPGARSAHLVMAALVTQQANGGSGYDATVRLRLDTGGGAGARTAVVALRNPFRPVDPDFSDGLGYQAYGAAALAGRAATAGGTLTVTMAYPFSPKGRHVAVKRDSLVIGYSVRTAPAPRRP